MGYRKTAETMAVVTCHNVGRPAGIYWIPSESNMFERALAYVIKSKNKSSGQDSDNTGSVFNPARFPARVYSPGLNAELKLLVGVFALSTPIWQEL
jgi:hypothetical protein